MYLVEILLDQGAFIRKLWSKETVKLNETLSQVWWSNRMLENNSLEQSVWPKDEEDIFRRSLFQIRSPWFTSLVTPSFLQVENDALKMLLVTIERGDQETFPSFYFIDFRIEKKLAMSLPFLVCFPGCLRAPFWSSVS